MMPASDDDPDLTPLAAPAGKPPWPKTAGPGRAPADARRPAYPAAALQVLQAPIERQKNPAKLTPAGRRQPSRRRQRQAAEPRFSRRRPRGRGAPAAPRWRGSHRRPEGNQDLRRRPAKNESGCYGGLLSMLAMIWASFSSWRFSRPAHLGPLDERNPQLGQLARRSLQQSEKPGTCLPARGRRAAARRQRCGPPPRRGQAAARCRASRRRFVSAAAGGSSPP